MSSLYPYFHMSITGKDQGAFPTDSDSSPSGKSLCYRMRLKSESPADANRGGQRALRNVGPLYVLKPLGAVTPHIMQAHWANETLTKVLLEFITNDGVGSQVFPYMQIELTNATVVGVQLHNGEEVLLPGVESAELHQYEEVAFHFEEMTIKHMQSKTVARYDWKNKGDLGGGALGAASGLLGGGAGGAAASLGSKLGL